MQGRIQFWPHQNKGEFDITHSAIYKRPSFPVSKEIVVSVDKEGKPLSLFGDIDWDFRAVVGGCRWTWSGGNNLSVTSDNLNLVKTIMLSVIYDKRITRAYIASHITLKSTLMKFASICDENKNIDGNGILLSELSNYPKIVSKLVDCFPKVWQSIFTYLERVNHYGSLGFIFLDNRALKNLAHRLATRDEHLTRQHLVIPPRIWQYQVDRLERCMKDFEGIKVSLFGILEEFFRMRERNIKSYKNLYGREDLYDDSFKDRFVNPFGKANFKGKLKFNKSLDQIFSEKGIKDVLRTYELYDTTYNLKNISRILNSFRDVALAYIQFFSLQRIKEVLSLNSDCLLIDYDERFGEIYILEGITTKTIKDSDARWIVPKRALSALNIAIYISRFFQKYSLYKNRRNTISVPLRYSVSLLGFNGGHASKSLIACGQDRYQLFDNIFESKYMKINKSDWAFAKTLTPDIINREEYGVGEIWKWTSHQCRRSMIVYMLSSGVISTESVQYLAKHLTSFMTLYYGRNYSHIILNEGVRDELILESYARKAKVINELFCKRNGVVFPNKITKVRDFISGQDEKGLIASFKNEKVGLRPTLLGFCSKIGYCEYGGIESITKCTGSNGGGICAEAIFSVDNHKSLTNLKAKYQRELLSLSPHSMRAKALKYEIHAIEIYEERISDK
ncbi:hypothetical protein [Salinimonas chungwhensis]|uniref:hypothetical protein n=1 Tax=Salinimonas chungwhensis TaxID=265425 RepID=UPI00037B9D90|nr:hypothetical protein [Salinimonas chungwhensis]